MPYSQSYTKYWLQETPIAKSLIVPRNLYKIQAYEYADGTLKTLTGQKTSIVFVLGISSDKKLLCIKITEVRPEKFFNWLKKALRKNVSIEDIDNAINESKIDSLLSKDNRVGTKTFSSVKNDAIYKMAPGAYRTYLLSGVKRISLLKIDGDYIKKLLGKKEEQKDK